MAGGTGFEPVLAESESAVLPLDDPPFDIGDIGTKLYCTPLPTITMGINQRWALISVSSIEDAYELFVVQLFCVLPLVSHELQIQPYAMARATSHHISTERV